MPTKARYFCVDCGFDTLRGFEYYVVHREIWQRFGVQKGMLCIGCLEQRVGRHLVPADFPARIRVNQDLRTGHWKSSTRLLSRIAEYSRPIEVGVEGRLLHG